jgi:hypothetical protein
MTGLGVCTPTIIKLTITLTDLTQRPTPTGLPNRLLICYHTVP